MPQATLEPALARPTFLSLMALAIEITTAVASTMPSLLRNHPCYFNTISQEVKAVKYRITFSNEMLSATLSEKKDKTRKNNHPTPFIFIDTGGSIYSITKIALENQTDASVSVFSDTEKRTGRINWKK